LCANADENSDRVVGGVQPFSVLVKYQDVDLIQDNRRLYGAGASSSDSSARLHLGASSAQAIKLNDSKAASIPRHVDTDPSGDEVIKLKFLLLDPAEVCLFVIVSSSSLSTSFWFT